jgi:hypothetical protein
MEVVMANETKKSQTRRPHGVPTRHRKPMDQIFEQLDATHPTPAKAAPDATDASFADPVGRSAIAVFVGGLVLGLGFTLLRRKRH